MALIPDSDQVEPCSTPELDSDFEQANEPFVIPTSAQILSIWEKSLVKRPLLGDVSFFEQGGTSLGALGILGEYYNQGFILTMADFYKNPTANAQVALLSKKFGVEEESHIEETVMDKKINEVQQQHHRYVPMVTIRNQEKPEAILLTGGSGFLGAHLLKALIEVGITLVYCLVRSGKEEVFQKTLVGYFGQEWLDEYSNRIECITGDISNKNLGLRKSDYDLLMRKVDAVYHAAADVRHYADEKQSLKTNLVGTENVIHFTKKANASLHHISTTSVAAQYLRNQPDANAMFFEMDFDIGQNREQNVYVNSKFLAEAAVYRAVDEGLEAHVYRIGRLVGRAKDGMFQKNPESNAFYVFLKAIGLAGAIPESMAEEFLELTPVDQCAQAVVALQDSSLTTLHLASPHLIPVSEIIGLNPKIRVVKDQDYNQVLKEFALQNNGHEVTPLLDYFNGQQGPKQKIETSTIITQNELVARGVQWKKAPVATLLSAFFVEKE